MAPNTSSAPTGVLFEGDSTHTDTMSHIHQSASEDLAEACAKESPEKEYRIVPVWRNVILFAYLHLAAVYGAYLIFSSAKLPTTIFAILLYQAGATGITAGAHRLWAHRAYKAKAPLKLILLLFNTLAFQNHVYEWARDHRVHHKFSETNADPHNAKRGFFFSHMGWLMCRKHPDVIAKGRCIDLSDLKEDKLVMFQKRHYMKLMPVICFVLPTVVPMLCWGESFLNAWFVATMFRYTLTLNVTWLVNSAAHMWGQRPYDKFINPSENLSVAILALGEGWHNYHHVFPWDYKTSELGTYSTNFTTAFIDFFARIGWAYDCKTVSPAMVATRAQRTGDGSHKDVWGWGDKEEKDFEEKNRPTEVKSPILQEEKDFDEKSPTDVKSAILQENKDFEDKERTYVKSPVLNEEKDFEDQKRPSDVNSFELEIGSILQKDNGRKDSNADGKVNDKTIDNLSEVNMVGSDSTKPSVLIKDNITQSPLELTIGEIIPPTAGLKIQQSIITTNSPTSEPTTQPTTLMSPTTERTTQPFITISPTTEPTTQPTITASPNTEPTTQPTVTVSPTTEPTTQPTTVMSPTIQPITIPPKEIKTQPLTTPEPTTLPSLETTSQLYKTSTTKPSVFSSLLLPPKMNKQKNKPVQKSKDSPPNTKPSNSTTTLLPGREPSPTKPPVQFTEPITDLTPVKEPSTTHLTPKMLESLTTVAPTPVSPSLEPYSTTEVSLAERQSSKTVAPSIEETPNMSSNLEKPPTDNAPPFIEQLNSKPSSNSNSEDSTTETSTAAPLSNIEQSLEKSISQDIVATNAQKSKQKLDTADPKNMESFGNTSNISSTAQNINATVPPNIETTSISTIATDNKPIEHVIEKTDVAIQNDNDTSDGHKIVNTKQDEHTEAESNHIENAIINNNNETGSNALGHKEKDQPTDSNKKKEMTKSEEIEYLEKFLKDPKNVETSKLIMQLDRMEKVSFDPEIPHVNSLDTLQFENFIKTPNKTQERHIFR
uniref:Acyl-CoA Delta(11) desaturase n=1 Tax=Cacopsylla melanoneura TaxID=428564 RepID=A0A8D8M386_9HEMI